MKEFFEKPLNKGVCEHGITVERVTSPGEIEGPIITRLKVITTSGQMVALLTKKLIERAIASSRFAPTVRREVSVLGSKPHPVARIAGRGTSSRDNRGGFDKWVDSISSYDIL